MNPETSIDIPTEPIQEETSVDNLVVEGETNDVVAEITDSNQNELNLLNDQSAENVDIIPSKLEENEVDPDVVVIDNYSTNDDIIENANDIIETAAPDEPVEKSNEVTEETMVTEKVTENAVEEIPNRDETMKEDTDSTIVSTHNSKYFLNLNFPLF